MRRIDPRLTRLIRRHRRPVAAVLAATGVLLAVTSLRTAPDPAVVVGAVIPPSELRPGEVAIPISLSSVAVARTLNTGDIIDVVGIAAGADDHAQGTVVAPRSRVLEVPDAGGSTFGSASSAVVLLAVEEGKALELSVAAAEGTLSVVIRARSMTR